MQFLITTTGFSLIHVDSWHKVTMANKRTHGTNALLANVSNSVSPGSLGIPVSKKRASAERAAKSIKEQAVVGATRGFHSSSNTRTELTQLVRRPSRHHSSDTTTTEEQPELTPYSSLQHMLNNRLEVLEQGFTRLQEYTERNTTFTIQKAHAVQVFAGLVVELRSLSPQVM